jgi:hypothetical protein
MYLSAGHRIYILKVVWNFEEDVGGWLMVAFRRKASHGHRIWDVDYWSNRVRNTVQIVGNASHG